MTSLSTYRTELESYLSTVNLSGFFDDAMKNRFINTAGRRVYNFENWDWLDHALKTQTEKDQEWYEQSSRFKKGGLRRITVKDSEGKEKEYDIVAWNLYQQYKDQGTQYKAGILANQFFLYPTPTVANLEIGTYGQLKWVDLSADADESINPEVYDDAIVKLAFAMALKKERRFQEAKSEIDEVEGNILPRLFDQNQKDAPKGYIGTAPSTRWD